MKITTFNRKSDVYPELTLNFNSSLGEHLISGGIYSTEPSALSPLEIDVYLARDSIGNYKLSSINFMHGINKFFKDIDIRKISIVRNLDNLKIEFRKDRLMPLHKINMNGELHDKLQSNIEIYYAEQGGAQFIMHLCIQHYSRIIDEETLAVIEYDILDES